VKNIYVFDTEGDGLEATKIHVFSVGNKDGIFSTKDYDKIRSFLTDPTRTLIGHNIIRWDIPTLERILGIEVKATLIDTLAVSWYLYPLQHKHGLEYWGEVLGTKKPEIDDWHNLSYDDYKHRCESDVKINLDLWKKFWLYLRQIYESDEEVFKLLRYLTFKMKCLHLAEKNKWKVDKEFITKSLGELEAEKGPKIDKLRESMPPHPVYKKRHRPKVMYKKDGTLSAYGKDWLDFLKREKLPPDHSEEVRYVDSYTEPNPGSTDQLKNWLFSLGWEPDLYKDDVPQINKERGQGLSDSVLALAEDNPVINELSDLSILNHRIPFLQGLLGAADENSYIIAGCAGFTNTLRLRHRVLVNLPKPDKKYSEAIRGSLVCEDDEIQIGSDLSSLEDRIKQHFMYKYDPKAVDEMNEPGYDPHLKLAETAGVVTHEQVELYKSGEDKSIKPVRDIFKNGNYACQYGAWPPRIAITCKVPIEKAQEIFDAYWVINKSIKQATDAQITKTVEGQQWLKNPISGFWYFLKKEKDIFSTLVQGSASFIFDMWLAFTLEKYDTLIGQFHDEFILRGKESDKERIISVIDEAIEKTNNYLKLNRKLEIGTEVGKRYSAIH
jgi:hypothetical protein